MHAPGVPWLAFHGGEWEEVLTEMTFLPLLQRGTIWLHLVRFAGVLLVHHWPVSTRNALFLPFLSHIPAGCVLFLNLLTRPAVPPDRSPAQEEWCEPRTPCSHQHPAGELLMQGDVAPLSSLLVIPTAASASVSAAYSKDSSQV